MKDTDWISENGNFIIKKNTVLMNERLKDGRLKGNVHLALNLKREKINFAIRYIERTGKAPSMSRMQDGPLCHVKKGTSWGGCTDCIVYKETHKSGCVNTPLNEYIIGRSEIKADSIVRLPCEKLISILRDHMEFLEALS